MALPIPGQSKNNWGDVLNDFLRVAHNEDGTLIDGASGADLTALTAEVDQVSATTARIERRAFDPRKNGAVGNGTTLDTAAFIDTIAEADGDWVVVSPGTYVLGEIDVTDVLRLQLDEGARLLLRPGAHTDMLINFTGTELTIRGPGIIDGNRANTTSRILIGGECPEGAVVDIDGVHLKSFYRGARFGNMGGYVNFSHNTITDQAQHGQAGGLHTTALTIYSGEVGASSPFVRTDFNRLIFTDTPDAPGTEPGGFFLDTRHDPSPESDGTGTAVKWEAIGNYFYGYGQNHSSNELGCLHSYPSPAQCRFIGNHFENFPITPINAKSVTDFLCVGNTFLNGKTNSAYVPTAGTILYAPGYHAGDNQHYRAVISDNIISNPGGTTTQGAHGIVVNAISGSIGREVVISGNVISTGGYGISLNYVTKAHISDNVVTALTSVTGQKRGVSFANITGDIEIVDNLFDVEHQCIAAISTGTLTGMRLWVKGNTIKTPSFAVDIRGVAMALLTGNTFERTGGSTAVNITADGSANPVAKLIWDRTNVFLEGTPNFVHANITAFEGREPLGTVGTGTVGAAAGTGASRTVTGDGDKGTISVTTGTGATTGTLITMTFSTRRAAPIVVLTPTNAAAAGAAAKMYVSSTTTTGFVVSVATSGLTDSTAHTWNYQII